MDLELELAVRRAAFEFIRREGSDRDGTWRILRSALAAGFDFHGRRVRLVGPQGIFKPALLDAALTLTTVFRDEGAERPYEDSWDAGVLTYRYRGINTPDHPDNEAMRRAWRHQLPLIYLEGLAPGLYAASFPAMIVHDDRRAQHVRVAFDEERLFRLGGSEAIPRREYITRLTRQRLHQAGFRQRVLVAYRTSCTMCRLRHEELLDAAHILPDGDPRAEPVVSSGLSLCKLHHAAYDNNLVGLRPDHVVEVRRDVLEEEDGPMLRFGLQGMHGSAISLPRELAQRPNLEFLAERYDQFRQTG